MTMDAVSKLPQDGSFLDGLQSLALGALGSYTAAKLPSINDRRDIAAIDVATSTALAQNQAQIDAGKAAAGIPTKYILVGVSILAAVGLYFALRRK